MKQLRRRTALLAAGLLATGLAVAGAQSAHATTCTASLGQVCGAYADSADIPPSNGYNTYLSPQDVGATANTTATLTTGGLPAPSGSPVFTSTVNAVPADYTGVQVFDDVQQLFNDWGTNGWNGGSDTPLSSLSALTVNFTETSPGTGGYEFAPDIWSNYAADVMFWTDTTAGRCVPGGYGTQVLGHFTMDGQNWTATRYGGPGAEIILVLDGSGGTGTCANEASGSVDVTGGMNWLATNGFIPSPVTLTQVNTGWEITNAASATFTLSSYSITATVAGSTPTPTPTPTPTYSAPSSLTQTPHVLVNFAWGDVGSPSYQFQLDTAAGTVVDSQQVTGTHLEGLEVVKDTKYQWRVSATGGSWSPWRAFTSP